MEALLSQTRSASAVGRPFLLENAGCWETVPLLSTVECAQRVEREAKEECAGAARDTHDVRAQSGCCWRHQGRANTGETRSRGLIEMGHGLGEEEEGSWAC